MILRRSVNIERKETKVSALLRWSLRNLVWLSWCLEQLLFPYSNAFTIIFHFEIHAIMRLVPDIQTVTTGQFCSEMRQALASLLVSKESPVPWYNHVKKSRSRQVLSVVLLWVTAPTWSSVLVKVIITINIRCYLGGPNALSAPYPYLNATRINTISILSRELAQGALIALKTGPSSQSTDTNVESFRNT